MRFRVGIFLLGNTIVFVWLPSFHEIICFQHSAPSLNILIRLTYCLNCCLLFDLCFRSYQRGFVYLLWIARPRESKWLSTVSFCCMPSASIIFQFSLSPDWLGHWYHLFVLIKYHKKTKKSRWRII